MAVRPQNPKRRLSRSPVGSVSGAETTMRFPMSSDAAADHTGCARASHVPSMLADLAGCVIPTGYSIEFSIIPTLVRHRNVRSATATVPDRQGAGEPRRLS